MQTENQKHQTNNLPLASNGLQSPNQKQKPGLTPSPELETQSLQPNTYNSLLPFTGSGYKRKTYNVLLTTISVSFIFLFTYTAVNKLIHHELFYNTVNIATGTKPFSVFTSWAVPVIELGIAALLLAPKQKIRSLGLLASFILMAVFTVYIAAMLAFDSKLPCSCGGIISQLSWKQHLNFNIVFSVIAFIGWRLERSGHDVSAGYTGNGQGLRVHSEGRAI